MRDDRERLEDSLEALERIEKYAVRGQAAVYEDELVQTWIVHHLMILGEASSGLSAEFRAVHPDEVWRQAVRLRNVIVHQYFGVDPEVVWGVIERDLPALKRRVWRFSADNASDESGCNLGIITALIKPNLSGFRGAPTVFFGSCYCGSVLLDFNKSSRIFFSSAFSCSSSKICSTSSSFICVASTSMSPTLIFNFRPFRASTHVFKA